MDEMTFHEGEQAAQQRWQTTDLWDAARKARLLWDHIPEAFQARIEAAPFFFLATSSPDGRCDCSFKGGGPGLIRLLDAWRFAFPDFDGNGAFMSLGNILLNPQVGCLFIDPENLSYFGISTQRRRGFRGTQRKTSSPER